MNNLKRNLLLLIFFVAFVATGESQQRSVVKVQVHPNGVSSGSNVAVGAGENYGSGANANLNAFAGAGAGAVTRSGAGAHYGDGANEFANTGASVYSGAGKTVPALFLKFQNPKFARAFSLMLNRLSPKNAEILAGSVNTGMKNYALAEVLSGRGTGQNGQSGSFNPAQIGQGLSTKPQTLSSNGEAATLPLGYFNGVSLSANNLSNGGAATLPLGYFNKMNLMATNHRANNLKKGANSVNSQHFLLMSLQGDRMKKYFTYDNAGRVITELNVQLLDTVWENNYRYNYTYDNNGLLQLAMYQTWGGDDWYDDARSTFTYDNNGRLISELAELNSEGWVKFYRITYTYDGAGNMTSSLWQDWDGTAWENSTLSSYTFDASGNILTETVQNWSNNQWVNDYRNSFTYNNNAVTTWLAEVWINPETGFWRNDYRISFTYNNDQNLATTLKEIWNTGERKPTEDAHWEYAEINTYSYTASGKREVELMEVWEDTVWVNFIKNSFEYDGNDNPTVHLTQFWQEGGWNNVYQTTNAFDNFGNTETSSFFTWINGNWISMETTLFFVYNNGASVGEIYSSFAIAAYQPITDVNDEEVPLAQNFELMQNFPNPFNPSTKIEFNLPAAGFVTLDVFSVQGEKVSTLVNGVLSAGKHGVAFDGAGLPSGVYFYRLSMELSGAVGGGAAGGGVSNGGSASGSAVSGGSASGSAVSGGSASGSITRKMVLMK
ncbi:MAG: T9SS type A sorting domain-containing protein [Ignavibacteriales bacterium]|nr:MAG: T9SS type A sorting domain-containing protein [Ignavibacteriaceae bacterium]MBW7873548.1 T9SS type A sorting domain-containing protein [Ignavibacteria bacterium]MCZ2143779.1 T9SS type A sorting domain-containing protein [Ignavibacteriales bacterium]MBV6445950.1 hypothetical protein [Ignavibacteriaceae bacterium]MBZ0196204.1 T9SS type A sorting domain-containing protein [Ignavibacteriaceae bacterium]